MRVRLVDGTEGNITKQDYDDEWDSCMFIDDNDEYRCVYKNEIETVVEDGK